MSPTAPPSWDDFRLILAVAEQGGLTRAAARLGINHSTAFRRLAALEAGLPARLFERHRSGYVPTEAGLAMAAAARRMEETAAAFARGIAGAAPEPSGELRVTTAASFAAGLLMPMLARFHRRYRAVVLDLVVSEEALNLSRRDADVAIRATDAPLPNLVGRRLSTLAWAVYARADTDPAASPWVSLGDAVGDGRFARFVEARGGQVALRLNTVLGLCEAVEAGIGVGALPCLAGDARPDLVRLGDPEPELESALWLLTHPDLRHAGRVRAFMEFMAEEIVPLRPLFEGRAAQAGRFRP